MINIISYDEAKQLKVLASREHIYLHPEFQYIGFYVGEKLAGVVAYTFRGKWATLRNDFILPEYRGKGIYKQLQNFRMKHIRSLGYVNIEINCNSVSLPIHLSWGAKVIKQFKTSTRLIYENIQ